MSDPLTLLLAWMAGSALGVLFFAGLWWTVHRAVLAKQPALWMLSSLLLRTGLTLVGFYVVSAGHPDRLLLCLLGFVMSRFMVIRLTRSSVKATGQAGREVSHAP